MTIALQDWRTGYYLDDSGGWTTYVQQARDFQSSAEAMNARAKHQVAQAVLVFRFEREGYAIRVPLDPVENGQPAPLAAAQ